MCFSELDDRCSFSHEYFMLQRRFETKFLLALTLFKELHNYVYICPFKECMHWMKSDMEVLTDKHYLSPSTTRAKASQCSFWSKIYIVTSLITPKGRLFFIHIMFLMTPQTCTLQVILRGIQQAPLQSLSNSSGRWAFLWLDWRAATRKGRQEGWINWGQRRTQVYSRAENEGLHRYRATFKYSFVPTAMFQLWGNKSRAPAVSKWKLSFQFLRLELLCFSVTIETWWRRIKHKWVQAAYCT